MLQQVRALRRSDAGFTLIELLIVIVILGILAAVVVFSVVGINNRGQQAACQADMSTVTTALEAYYAKNTQYPPDLAAMTAGADKFLNPPAPTTVAYAPVASGGKNTSYTLGPAGACA